MKPELFGRGSWYLIFTTFYYYQDKLNKYMLKIKNIKESLNHDNSKHIEIEIKKIFTHPSLIKIENIKKLNLKELYIIINNSIMEILKNKILLIINSLPCLQCKDHSILLLNKNNILNTNSFLYMFHFFIELRNSFYPNKIDRALFNNMSDISQNKDYLLFNIIKIE